MYLGGCSVVVVCEESCVGKFDFRYRSSVCCSAPNREQHIFFERIEGDRLCCARECSDVDLNNLVSCNPLDRSATDRNDTFDIPVGDESDVCCFWVDLDLTRTNKCICSSFCSDASNIEEQISFQRIEGDCLGSTRKSCNVAFANEVSCSGGSSNTTNLG